MGDRVKVKGKVSCVVMEDTEDEKAIRIFLGEVRCPKHHKKGDLVCYLLYDKEKAGLLSFKAQIQHSVGTEKEMECWLASERYEDIVRILPEVIA